MIQTFQDYLNEKFGRKTAALREAKLNGTLKVFGEAVENIDPRESCYIGFEDSNSNIIEQETLTLPELIQTTNSIRDLQKSEVEMTPDSVSRALSQSPLLTKRFDWNLWQNTMARNLDCVKFAKNRELSVQEKNTVLADTILYDVLNFKNNYSIWVFGKDETAIKEMSGEVSKVFNGNYETEKFGRYETILQGKPGVAQLIKHPGNIGDVNGSEGSGLIARLDEWPENKVMARWYGRGIDGSEFALRIAKIVQDKKYCAHFDFLQQDGVIGGIFYDPEYKPRGKNGK